MILASQALVCLALVAPPAGRNQPALTDYQKLHRALTTKTLWAGAPVGRMLDLGVPTWRRRLGRFTEYDYELLPGYHGVRLLAKDGRLRWAVQYDCTHPGTFFDDLTAEETRQYEALREQNKHVPPDWCIGRYGWHRPPRRLWDCTPGGPASGR